MADYDFPDVPEIEKAYRTAYKALAALVPPRAVIAEEAVNFHEVLSQFRFLVDSAELATAGQLGPHVSWRASRRDGDWGLIASGIDLDDGVHEFGDVQLNVNAFEDPNGRWHGSALERAGLAYKRACGWDFAPGEAGVWLVMLAPESGRDGEDDQWFYSGRIAGFIVIYDRDEDGDYESVGHIWTVTAWQRRGVARRLLAEAGSRFPITVVEEPYTDDGAAFLDACRNLKITLQD